MILIGLGANLPDEQGQSPEAIVEAAIAAVGRIPGISFKARSRLWRSAPVPASDQPWFVNAVMAVERQEDGDLRPGAVKLLWALHGIEAAFGRVRRERWEARVLDLDIIAFGDRVAEPEWPSGLELPHPRLAERAFVLRPLAEIAPGWRHPATGATVEEMIAALDPAQSCEPLGD